MQKLWIDKSGWEYYLFKPSLFNFYSKEEDKSQMPSHIKVLTHKLHMLLYFICGGYRILYLKKDGEIAGYIVFTRSKNWIVRGTNKQSIYTIFIYTCPLYRGQGIASKMLDFLLNKDFFTFQNSYKTIDKNKLFSGMLRKKIRHGG